ncbi:MAG: PKD domain-containing protein, partial [Candidatus Yonathbacteria bacterium]|nr:PKD domain-containing protein [Candidatus Yonathbacteria bacterium]
ERTVTLPNKATLTALATDDGIPTNVLTYLWSKASGPGSVTFSSLTTKTAMLTFGTPGTYQITATVSDGDLFSSYTITLIVSSASAPATTTPPTNTLPSPTLTFTASKTTLTKGAATTLSWSSTNTISCTATQGWGGSKTATGSATFTPQTTTTYTLMCKGGAGDQVAKSVTVTVMELQPQPIPTAGPACNVIFASGFEGPDIRFVGQWGPYLTGVDSVFDKIYPRRSNWSALPFHDSDNTESTGAFFNHIVGNRLYNGVGKMSLEYAYTEIVNYISYAGGASLHSKVSKAAPEAGDGNMSRMQWEYALKPDHGLESGYIGFRMRLPSDLEAIMADNGVHGDWQQLFQLRELVDGCEYSPNQTIYSTDVVINYNANATPKLRFWTHRGTHYCNGTNYDGGDTSQQAVPADGKWHHYEFFWDRDAGIFRFKLDGEIIVDWSGVKMKVAKPMHQIKPIYMYTSEPWEGDATRQPIERWYDDLYICDDRPTGF